MTLRTLRPTSNSSRYATRLAIALALGCAISAPAHAFRLAHSRIVSAADKPLQVLVGIADLTPDEQRSLMATLADPAAWERAGVTPPVPLSSMTLRLEGGASSTRRNLRISSSEAAKGPVVDLLLNLGTSAGQRQVQVSVMQTAGGFPGLTSQAQVGGGRAGRGAGRVNVHQGDTLYGIAQSHAVPDTTIYQMLVALWRANPRAFIQNNMNLVKAGATLIVPDAATVRAVDPAEARRIFIEQQEAYARYRASLAGAAARGAAAAGQSSTAGQVGATPPGPPPEPASQDRLRLSSGEPGKGDAQAQAQARADSQVSMAKATQDAQGRVNELERNVKDLNAALAAARAGGQGGGNTAVRDGDRAAAADGQPGGLTVPSPFGAGGSGAGAAASTHGSSAQGSQGGASSGGSAGTAAQPGAGGAAAALSQGGASSQPGSQGSAESAHPTGAAGAGGHPSAANQSGVNQSGAGNGGQGGSNQTAAGATPGVSGDASTLGGAAGTGGTPGSTSGAGGASSQSGASGNGAGVAPAGQGSSASPSGAGGAAPSPAVPGSVSGAGSSASQGSAITEEPNGPAADKDGASSKASDASGLPAWLSDNLLIILTAVLALIAFVIAWLLRRAAARRDDDQDDLDDELYMSEMDQGAIDRRLEGINLDLDEPAPEEDRPRPGPVRT